MRGTFAYASPEVMTGRDFRHPDACGSVGCVYAPADLPFLLMAACIAAGACEGPMAVRTESADLGLPVY